MSNKTLPDLSKVLDNIKSALGDLSVDVKQNNAILEELHKLVSSLVLRIEALESGNQTVISKKPAKKPTKSKVESKEVKSTKSKKTTSDKNNSDEELDKENDDTYDEEENEEESNTPKKSSEKKPKKKPSDKSSSNESSPTKSNKLSPKVVKKSTRSVKKADDKKSDDKKADDKKADDKKADDKKADDKKAVKRVKKPVLKELPKQVHLNKIEYFKQLYDTKSNSLNNLITKTVKKELDKEINNSDPESYEDEKKQSYYKYVIQNKKAEFNALYEDYTKTDLSDLTKFEEVENSDSD